ncbi:MULTISPECIES: bestrophin-like domain [Providencia]|uniref:DUF4239 domain-containing protein n=1 Tax=Providencia heimbachae ATCC 35613 TaxID=1354272 RepID=A0A1B7K298_9GAMM|nr:MULTISPECIES: DUF4239 domain-containing protein [Providencia]MBP6121863.1 DUF4239 domain-containing protein [Providencia sp.]MDD9340621.1 DUF4239 domain-containing protein [Providencia heimbachae]NIH23072.1 DUF4239 domain-containing protein [Providencia heimbachae]OAT54277.1 hypothetical protein M998_0609 [Providencia heimbachae ATCC 35613]QCJ70553.1 DUF4239 domain-containing protein [Providencia heimbachae]
MFNLSEFINDSPIDSILLFVITFVLLVIAAYVGKFIFKRKNAHEEAADDEAKIILGAILSLLGLLIGFVLSISINGYNNRQQTEENEAIAIGNAYQRAQLLGDTDRMEASKLLQQYLEARIEFFKSGVSDENNQWRMLSLQKQNQLWEIGVKEAHQSPNPVVASVLSAFSDLYLSQQKTMASWRHQIPNATWFLLIFFAICSNVLIGYNIRGTKGKNWLILILPSLTTLALFMIAEIDIPGEGVIHVTPDDLVLLQDFLFKDGAWLGKVE